MPFLSYTIFADAACSQVRSVANLFGDDATRMLRTMRDVKGSEPRERDMIAGCRIDRIGSEDEAAAL